MKLSPKFLWRIKVRKGFGRVLGVVLKDVLDIIINFQNISGPLAVRGGASRPVVFT